MEFKLKSPFLFLLICNIALSQTSENRAIGVSLAGGVGYAPGSHNFSSGPDDIPLRPRVAAAASICYSGVQLIEPTNLEISLEYSYSRTSTNATTVYYGTFTNIREHSRIMVWPRLIVPGTFSPFLEFGVGFGSFQITEEVHSGWSQSKSGTARGLVLGGGGGISYTVSSNIRIDGYFQDTRLFKDLFLDPIRRRFAYKRPAIMTLAFRVYYFL